MVPWAICLVFKRQECSLWILFMRIIACSHGWKRLEIGTLEGSLERLCSQQLHAKERNESDESMHGPINARDFLPKYVFQIEMQVSWKVECMDDFHQCLKNFPSHAKDFDLWVQKFLENKNSLLEWFQLYRENPYANRVPLSQGFIHVHASMGFQDNLHALFGKLEI